MKKLNLSHKTLLSVALLGGFVAMPLATPVAQADPPAHAPAHGRRDNNRNNATYTGIVTNVRTGNSFDVRANDRIYNVYTSSSVPRGLSQGDRVRIYGRPYGDNDIRSASVSILDNQRDNDDRDDNANGYRSYSGIVSNVRSNREFDIRVGSTTYNVYAASSTPRLSNNDTVRVYGQRVGNNDLRNANATVTRNR